MISIGIKFDTFTSAVESQLTRDLLALKTKYPKQEIAVVCATPEPQYVLEALDIALFPAGTSDLQVIYKVSEFWPEYDDVGTVILRDLYVDTVKIVVDTQPYNGYYLPEQSRPTAPRINRTNGPAGRGYVDPLILQIWGGPNGMDSTAA